ncbi:hypothetical protein Tco_0199908 [Tanacetum coccineum]
MNRMSCTICNETLEDGDGTLDKLDPKEFDIFKTLAILETMSIVGLMLVVETSRTMLGPLLCYVPHGHCFKTPGVQVLQRSSVVCIVSSTGADWIADALSLRNL